MMFATGAQVTAAVTLVTTAETIIVTSPVIDLGRDAAFVMITAYAQLTPGTSTTSVTPTIRRGSTTAGTIIGVQSNVVVTAGNLVQLQYVAIDQGGPFGTVQYVFTLIQNAATANGTAPFGAISCTVQA